MQKFFKFKPIITTSALVIFLSLLLLPTTAKAVSLVTVGTDVLVLFVKAIAFILNAVFGFLLTLAASLVDWMLQMNYSILENNALVKIGWGITRDIANLGFVLAIIVIAFSIIVQYKQYGSQKLLVRLISAAILVNFSFAIAGAVIDFSNVITKFFLEERIGSNTVATTIAGAFGPQRLLLENEDDLLRPPGTDEAGGLTTLSSAAIVSITGLIFTVVFTFLAALTLLALAIMLIVRYVYLSMLIILAPIAWLFWVIPQLEKHFHDWWSKFFKWAFFAPAVSFFIYLTIVGAEELSSTNMELVSGKFFSSTLSNIMVQGSQMILLVGLLMGGLIAAEKMGIAGAQGAIGIAKNAGVRARKWSGRKSTQWGTGIVRGKIGGRSLAERARQTAGKNTLSRLALGGVARGLTRLETAGGESVAKQYDKQVDGMSTNSAKAALLAATGPRKIALMKKLARENEFGDQDATRLVSKGNQELFERFGQGKEWKNIKKAAGMDVDMAQAIGEGNEKELQPATDKYVASLTKKDVDSIPFKDIFSGKAKLGLDEGQIALLAKTLATSIAGQNHVLVSSILPKLDAVSRNNFKDTYQGAAKNFPDAAQAFKKTLENYATGGFGGEETGKKKRPEPPKAESFEL